MQTFAHAAIESSTSRIEEPRAPHYKIELIHRRAQGATSTTWNTQTLEWIDCFNNRRLLASIGNVPAEHEAKYYQSGSQLPMAA